MSRQLEMAGPGAGAPARRAYTNPVNVPAEWPFVNTNPFDLQHFRRWVEEHGGSLRAVLVDTGVHTLFRDPRRRDYPPGFLSRYIQAIHEAARVLERHASTAELYYVVPDIPVDYPGREHLYPWNVRRTVEYAREFLRLRRGIPGEPVAVVQGRPGDPWGTVKAYLDNVDVYGEYGYLALGPTCTSRNVRALAAQIAAFDSVIHTRFHAFGVHSSVLSYMARHGIPACRLHSIDTSSYYWDIHYRFGRGKTPQDKARILRWRMERVQRLLAAIPCNGRRITDYLMNGDLSIQNQ